MSGTTLTSYTVVGPAAAMAVCTAVTCLSAACLARVLGTAVYDTWLT